MMKTDFDEWLALLAAGNKGGPDLCPGVIPAAVRGQAWTCAIELPGDYSGATIAGAIRVTPDAPSALATMTVTSGTYSGATNTTTFTASLAAGTGSNSTGALPADTDGNGYVALPAALTITPSGGSPELLMGWAFIVQGKV
jgi:hypothetical protein